MTDRIPIAHTGRARQVCVLGSAEPGSSAYELAGAAGELLARLGITVVSGCGSPATRVAAQRALDANGVVVSIVPSDDINLRGWPCTVLIPCGMGDARNLLMALAGDACLVIGGRAGTISEVCLAWLHRRPLLPLTGCGGWSDQLEKNPPDERGNSRILSWSSIEDLERNLRELGLVGAR
ncbi:MAG: Rossmann fold nucleotide-binding protein [Steroidobacteraceae bacterium]